MAFADRDECLTQIRINHEQAQEFCEDILDDRDALYLYFPYITNAYIQGAFGQCANAMLHTVWALRAVFAYTYLDDVDSIIHYFLDQYTAAGGAELTWKSIIAAWIDANDVGRLWTILTIDELRKDVWDMPYTTFEIAGAPV